VLLRTRENLSGDGRRGASEAEINNTERPRFFFRRSSSCCKPFERAPFFFFLVLRFVGIRADHAAPGDRGRKSRFFRTTFLNAAWPRAMPRDKADDALLARHVKWACRSFDRSEPEVYVMWGSS